MEEMKKGFSAKRKKQSKHASLAADLTEEPREGKHPETLTPNRKKHFLKSRENERNYEVIASSERISESNNLAPGGKKGADLGRFHAGPKAEKVFRIDKTPPGEISKQAPRVRRQGEKGGDYLKLTKKYQELNLSEKPETLKRVPKSGESGSSGSYFRKGYF